MNIRKHRRNINRANWADIEVVSVSILMRFKRNLSLYDMIDKSEFGRWDEVSNLLDGVYWPIVDKYDCDGVLSWCHDQNLFDGDITVDLANMHNPHNKKSVIEAVDQLIAHLTSCNQLVDKIVIHPSMYKIRAGQMFATSAECVRHLADKYRGIVEIDQSCVRKL